MLKDQLAVSLLQQIEDSVLGLGPHVLHAALKTAGFKNLALRVIQYARKAYKSKLVDLSTCKQKGCIGGVTIQAAVLDEFKKSFLKAIPGQLQRMEKIFSTYMPKNTRNVTAKKKGTS